MTVAERARQALRARPFLHEGLRAGVLNYSATARLLGFGDEEAVAAALRRYAEELPARDWPDRAVRVTMHSGLGATDDCESTADALLAVGDINYVRDAGSSTAVLAVGDVDAQLLTRVLGRLDAEGVAVEAAGVGGDHLVVIVDRRDGPDTVRLVEATASADGNGHSASTD